MVGILFHECEKHRQLSVFLTPVQVNLYKPALWFSLVDSHKNKGFHLSVMAKCSLYLTTNEVKSFVSLLGKHFLYMTVLGVAFYFPLMTTQLFYLCDGNKFCICLLWKQDFLCLSVKGVALHLSVMGTLFPLFDWYHENLWH